MDKSYSDYCKRIQEDSDNITHALNLQKSLIEFVRKKVESDLTTIKVSTIANMIEESKK